MRRLLKSVAARCLLGIGLLVVAAPAAAEDEPLGTHQRHLRLEAGVRTQFVGSGGLDPFAKNDVVAQFTTGASYVLLTSDRLSLAAGALLDLGGKGSAVRGSTTSLDLYRVGLGAEARYHVLRVAAATLRVSPTLSYTHAKLTDPSAGALVASGWAPGFDATAGAVVELYGYATADSRKPRIWLAAEGGYGWSTAVDLVLRPEEAGTAPVRLAPLNLGELSLSGPLFRVTAAVSF